MSTLRFQAVKEAFSRKPVCVTAPKELTSEYFGINVFDRKVMGKYLSKESLKKLIKVIDEGELLDRDLANEVADAMHLWAKEKGATHYTHWFHPLTDGTAEKHDAFIEINDKGDVVEKFSGKILIQQESDASSFPNGGIRNTFEARGYTAWDPSSPAFVIDDTLCIPTVFISYTGEALDYKAPLLKAIHAVSKAATEVCSYFDPQVKNVISYLGWEQEYFLVDEALYAARPDLSMTERTLMGHESARNQQLEDHYFGSIPMRVAAFMKELEFELYKLGIPVKTRHNEVAPNQFELAPIFGETNLAVDQNLVVMSMMHRVASGHHFKVLLHEKPFAGVNGSGKHNNWSLGTDTGVGLLSPGKNPDENLVFVTFLVNVMMAVYKHNGLLKASIMSAANEHRLGGDEAPPAIVSIFMGSELNQMLDRLESSEGTDAIEMDDKKRLRLAISHIPEVLIDNTDRNRTSPFAFTGNRFEFRAVGSSANCAAAMIALNAIVADQLTEFKTLVDQQIETGMEKEEALFNVLRQYIKDSKAIRFDGNGYSEEWRQEAQSRGLDCEISAPVIFDAYLKKESIDMFRRMGVFTERELHARNEVKWEIYTKKIQIESRVLGDLVMNHIIPVASRYQLMLLDNVCKMHTVYPKEKATELTAHDLAIIEEIAMHVETIKNKTDLMVEFRKVANQISLEREKAVAYHDQVVPMLKDIRYHVDKLELIVDNEMWTLPKYRELMFIR